MCIFYPLDNFPAYTLSFCEKNLSLLKMTKKVKGYSQNQKDEYYNILDIYLGNGLKKDVEVSQQILEMRNAEGV